jgi:hypothetical protein
MKRGYFLRKILIGVLCACVILLSACTAAPQDASTGGTAEGDSAILTGGSGSEILEIGDLTIDQQFEISNVTGMTITALAIKGAQESSYPQSQTLNGLNWESGKTARVHFDPQVVQQSVSGSGAADEPQASGREYDVAFKQLFDIELTFADGTKKELHNVDLNTLRDTVLEYADGVAYLSYTDETGAKARTLDAEKAAQVSETPAESEGVTVQSQSLSTSPYGYSYDEPSSGGSTGGGSGGASSVEQDPDLCVDDLVFR